jgi:hypothetical protein
MKPLALVFLSMNFKKNLKPSGLKKKHHNCPYSTNIGDTPFAWHS